MNISSPQKTRPMIATILGEGGIGKTELASLFPGVIFARTEDGMAVLTGREDVKMFDIVRSSQDLYKQIKFLLENDHEFKTLVIDSVTKLHSIIEAEVVDADPKAKSINQASGGYGAGYKEAANIHRHITDLCQRLREEKNMSVLYLAHSAVEDFNPADDESYSRYTLRINKHSIAPYVDDVDLVAHIKLQTFVTGEEGKKKASSTGKRIIVCHSEATSVAKNRYGISEPLEYKQGENPIITAVYGGK